MKKLLVLGAGRSTHTLVTYLKKKAQQYDWQLTIGDLSVELAARQVVNFPGASAIPFNIHDDEVREGHISQADLVISMLPAHFHPLAAASCLKHKKNFLTASYVSPEIKKMDQEVRRNGNLFLMECGLDPGIDHMSAMRVLDDLKKKGAELLDFETFTGGLLAPNPEEDNPWQYKFTWNPRNVVLAGQGGVKFKQEGTYKYIPYHRLFRRFEILHIPGYGYFEGYGNRDSLKYIDIYGLRGIRTMYRGTLRRPGFCKAWNTFVQIGATDDTYEMEMVGKMTHRDFINSFLLYNPNDSVELKLAHYMGMAIEGREMYCLKWLGIFSNELVGLERGTPAQILEHILKKRWQLTSADKDMIVMLHKFKYAEKGELKEIQSHMVCTGKDEWQTGMSMTVGLPLGIAAELILTKDIQETGVCIPNKPGIYLPLLKGLGDHGISFTEQEKVVTG
ncbi:MAG: saccharopine dehydrogenase family protein [Bacteroidota bacterium]